MSIKLFSLVPVVNKLDVRTTGNIECFCYSNSILFIGTSDGNLFRYSINRSKHQGENIGFKSVIIDSKLINQKKPINQITFISEAQKILILSDGILNPLNFHDLEPCANFFTLSKIKNVTTYCFSEKYKENLHSFGLEKSLLCVCIKGRLLQLYFIEKNTSNATFFKEIALTELCLQIEINKSHICVACDSSYLVIDIYTSNIQTLFSYEIENLTPHIVNHIEGEFLLNCQGNLGMFATFEGKTTRPPISWCENCLQFRVSNPYVLCATNDSIKVYNLADSKLKQSIEFGPIRSMHYIEDENIIFLSTSNKVYALNPHSPANQINQLLENKRVNEALELFELLYKKLNSIEYDEKYKNLKKKCGLIEMIENENYSKSLVLFLESSIHYKQLLTFADENHKEDEEMKEYLDRFEETNKSDEHKKSKIENIACLIVDFMLKSKTTIRNQEYVATIFKLCADHKPQQISRLDFLSQLPIQFCLQNIQLLQDYKLIHSEALVYLLSNQNEDAFKIWKSLCDGTLQDEYFPGMNFVIEQLSRLKDYQLLWRNIDWVMNINQAVAIKIFTQREVDELASERMRPDNIIDYLMNYKEALILYLEYLIYEKNIKKEKYNSQLIGAYLENLFKLIKQSKEEGQMPTGFEPARLKLQNILQTSSNYRAQAVLGKIKEYESYLQKECAILYGKIEEHEKALKILVYILHDYSSATDYCLKNSKESLKQRKYLFNILFSIYMNPEYSEKEKLLKPCLNLLNSPLSNNFDIPKLIGLIPNNWSIKLTNQFLENVLQNSLSKKCNTLVKKNIYSNYKFSLQDSVYALRKEQLYIDEDSRCSKCFKSFDSCIFTRQSNGKLCHTTCKDAKIK